MIKQDVEADSYFREYQHASGLEIDRRRLIYHIVQVVMRCAVTCGVRQFHDEARDDARPKQLREMLEAALDDAAAGDMRKLPPLPAGV